MQSSYSPLVHWPSVNWQILHEIYASFIHRLRWQWGDLLHMCAHDAICCPLGNKFGVKVPSAARWRNANEEQNRKISIKMFTRMDILWVWLMDCVDRGQDLEVIHVYYREHSAKDLSMSIRQMKWDENLCIWCWNAEKTSACPFPTTTCRLCLH